MSTNSHARDGVGRDLFAFILVLALLAPGLAAKERRGADLLVNKRDGSLMEGELLAVRGNTLILMLEANSAGVEVELKEVATITVVKKSKFGKGLLWGTLIGGAAGAVIGSASYKPSPHLLLNNSRGEAAAYIAIFLGGIGAIEGGLAGAGAGKDERIVIAAGDPISVGRVVGRLQELARDRS